MLWSKWLHLSWPYHSFGGAQTWEDPAERTHSVETQVFSPSSAGVKDYTSMVIAVLYACTVLKKQKRLPNWELIVDSTCFASKDLYRDTVASFVENS